MCSARKNRSGFTLVELIVAMAISTIVMGVIITVTVLMYQSYDANTQQATAQNLAVLTMQKVKDSVRYSPSVAIYDDTTAASGATGTLVYYDSTKNGIDIGSTTYLQGAFKGYTCNFDFSNNDTTHNNLLGITITINDNKGKPVFSTTGSVYLMNGNVADHSTVAKNHQMVITYS